MATTKELKLKIGSLANTRKITKAMKMIATTKFRKAQIAVEKSNVYNKGLQRVLNRVLSGASVTSSLSTPHAQVKKIAILAFSGDKGLCGGFNANIIKKVINKTADFKKKDIEVEISYAGVRAYKFFKNKDYGLGSFHEHAIKEASYEEATSICKELTDKFESGDVDEVYLVYNFFNSAIEQTPVMEKLFPLEMDTEEKVTADVIFEPSAEVILESVISQSVKFKVFRALLNSVASEHAARMTAMDSATNNASDMIDKYTLQMNRARQTAITTELTEIIAGAESL